MVDEGFHGHSRHDQCSEVAVSTSSCDASSGLVFGLLLPRPAQAHLLRYRSRFSLLTSLDVHRVAALGMPSLAQVWSPWLFCVLSGSII